jgi:hypothetical protein
MKMNQFGRSLFALAALSLAISAQAQVKELPGETKTLTGVVDAIDHATRTITLRGPEGNFLPVAVPPESKKFDQIKIGDKLSLRYYENVVLRVKKPGEPDVDSASEGLTPGAAAKPGGTKAKQRTITAKIEAIDMEAPSISFSGPNGWKYSSRVADKKALEQVKVGDKVDITWTTAVLVGFDEPTK